MKQRGFIILDFGSQLTQLIARRLRELGYYSEILSFKTPTAEIRERNPYGIILSGGPNSVYEENSPHRSVRELMDIAPILGICYGMQLIAHDLGGKVERATHREYGLNKVNWKKTLSGRVPAQQTVWMSHGDYVAAPPPGFEIVGISDSHHAAAMCGPKVWAFQFHPEVSHTQNGDLLLAAFAEKVCEVEPDWTAPHMTEMLIEGLREKVPADEHVLVGLSGGVDSTVVATLLTKALGAERVHCVFVNNGLLRKEESSTVLENYKKIGLNVLGVDATQEFLSQLQGQTDPEAKRKTIGRVFIEVFEKNIPKEKNMCWLAQGTLYPDVIESISSVGGSVTIKSHHNVGGLPERMKLKLIEPVRELFKDEVRRIGKELGLPHELLWRHPFPGPGLAIRVIGDITEEKLQILREADAIFIQALRDADLYEKIWQAFCVLLPIHTVGVQGDARSYDRVLALRAVTSQDGMTADWYPFSYEFLREVSNKITNKVRGINRVVYDVTSKPPGTIEWE
jgi:GMP synthase (glutamine-hydrolysing)